MWRDRKIRDATVVCSEGDVGDACGVMPYGDHSGHARDIRGWHLVWKAVCRKKLVRCGRPRKIRHLTSRSGELRQKCVRSGANLGVTLQLIDFISYRGVPESNDGVLPPPTARQKSARMRRPCQTADRRSMLRQMEKGSRSCGT